MPTATLEVEAPDLATDYELAPDEIERYQWDGHVRLNAVVTREEVANSVVELQTERK